MAQKMTPAMIERNKLGALIQKKAPEDQINAQRVSLATLKLEAQIQTLLDLGVTHGKIAYLAKKLAGAK